VSLQHRATEEHYELISELYYTCDRDRARMQQELLRLGMNLNRGGTLDESILYHLPIRRRIVEKAREMQKSGLYTREEHIRKLQQIRDGALGDENWKVGLAAEVAVGKAAGLYESFDPEGESGNGKLIPPQEMSTDAIRAKLAQLSQRQLPAPENQGPPVQQGEFDRSELYGEDDAAF
jgi:hypothetical protein